MKPARNTVEPMPEKRRMMDTIIMDRHGAWYRVPDQTQRKGRVYKIFDGVLYGREES